VADRERVQRLVFGEDAETYDRARPQYPAALIDEIVALPGRDVRALDAGCGTGKATVMLAQRGVTGVALEPDPEMAAVGRRNLESFGDAWAVVERPFEDAVGDGAPSGSFDLVTAAQSWHWMDPTVRLERARALLRPGGWLALFWNKGFWEPTLLRRRFDELYATLCPEMGYGPTKERHYDWSANRGQPAGWEAVRARTYAWSQVYTRAEYVDLMSTASDHRMLEPDVREALLRGLGDAIDELSGGQVELPYTVALWCARRV
jgi:SAM-dependent methyltransferase